MASGLHQEQISNTKTMNKINVILADCEVEEIESFTNGISDGLNEKFSVISAICNWGHRSIISNLRRYFIYFAFPFKIFLQRKKYDTIICWQQFFAINFAFFCRLFNVRKCCKVVAVNFTFKEKTGLSGRIFNWYMRYSTNGFIDIYHIPSYSFAKRCSEELCIDISKFAVTGFGVPDLITADLGIPPCRREYCLSIGRSNRDFDFLVNVWSQPQLAEEYLIIASDAWKPAAALPENVEHRTDIGYTHSFKWIKHCKMNICSMMDGNMASGDTVLLTGMMFGKPAAITVPSTLENMYVTDGVTGICIPKDASKAAIILSSYLEDKSRLDALGLAAREEYERHFTRYNMGIELSAALKGIF